MQLLHELSMIHGFQTNQPFWLLRPTEARELNYIFYQKKKTVGVLLQIF